MYGGPEDSIIMRTFVMIVLLGAVAAGRKPDDDVDEKLEWLRQLPVLLALCLLLPSTWCPRMADLQHLQVVSGF